MKDGGEVAIDWMDNDLPENAPLILILPGLTGKELITWFNIYIQYQCRI